MSSAEQAYHAGNQALKQNQHDQALKRFQQCYTLCKQNGQPGSKLAAQACIGMIKCYRAKGQTENAIALCRKLAKSANPQLIAWAQKTLAALGATEAPPKGAKALYQSGIQAFKKKQYTQAIEALQQFDQWCQQQPETPPLQAKAQMGLVKCYQATEQIEAAIALCQQLAQTAHPTLQPWATQTLAELEARLQPTELLKEERVASAPSDALAEEPAADAPKPAATLSEPTPEDPKLLEAGLKANRKANHTEAIELLTNYLRCQPSETSRNFLQAQMALVKAYIATEQIEAAIARCQELKVCNNMALKNWANKTLGDLLPPEELAAEEPEAVEPTAEEPEADALSESELASPIADEVTPRPQRRSPGTSTARKSAGKSKPKQNQAPAEFLWLGGTFVAALVFTWLASGSIVALGPLGVLSFILAIAEGAAWANPSMKMIRSGIGFVLVVLYFITPGIGVLIINFFGVLIGFIGFHGMRAALRRSDAESLTAPQPLRMIGALVAGILLAIVPAFVFINSVTTQLAGEDEWTIIASATPLHQAIGQKDVAAVNALILAGSDVNMPDAYGQTPLHWSVSGCITFAITLPGSEESEEDVTWDCEETSADLEITKLLLENGSNPNPGPDQFGDTLMGLAYGRYEGDTAMVSLLQQYGAQ